MPRLQIPGAYIVDDGITENVVRHIFPFYILRVFTDHNPQLALIVKGIHQACVSRDGGIRSLGIADPF